MLPDRVSNPGPLTYESAALPIALRGQLVKGGFDPLKANSILKSQTDMDNQGKQDKTARLCFAWPIKNFHLDNTEV